MAALVGLALALDLALGLLAAVAATGFALRLSAKGFLATPVTALEVLVMTVERARFGREERGRLAIVKAGGGLMRWLDGWWVDGEEWFWTGLEDLGL